MNCENMDNGERPTVLFIFTYQIWMKLMKLKWVQPQMGGDSRNWNWYVAGTLAREKENMAGTLAKEKEKGRDSGKRKENVAGTPAKEKKYVAGTSTVDWWYGGDSHKKRAGTPANVRGCEFDKQTWRGEKLASHNQTCIWMDSIKSVLWFEILKISLLRKCCITRFTTWVG